MKKGFKVLITDIIVLAVIVLIFICHFVFKANTNTYTNANGMYSVTLPGKWQDGGDLGVPNLLLLTGKNEFAIILGMKKGQILGSADADIENLEDFSDYMESSFMDVPEVTFNFNKTEGDTFPNALRTVSKTGTATHDNGEEGHVVMECAETENAYYCFLFMFEGRFSVKRIYLRDALAFEELNILTEVPSDTIRWFNASCAILTKINGGTMDLIGGHEPSFAIRSSSQRLLIRAWDVNDAASLIESVEWLTSAGSNQEALENIEAIGITGDTRDEVLAELEADGWDENNIIWIMAVFDAKAAYGDLAISGYDYSRAMSLLGWGYLSKYLTYEETMDKMLKIAQEIQQNFDSWDDFIASYFYGYTYWNWPTMELPSSEFYERYQVYEDIKAEENSVFSVDFKTELQKEW